MNFGTKNLLKEIIKHKPIQHKPIKQNSIEKPKKKKKIKKNKNLLMCWFDSQCYQTDVDSALPYADIKEVILIKPPVGVRVPPGCVLRLKKVLFGLIQAPRAWYQLVTSDLIDFNFTRVFYGVYLLSGANMVYWKSSVL